MCVTEYSYKLEFQGRGAPHYHGILWLNLAELEQKIIIKDFEPSDSFEYNIQDLKPNSLDKIELDELIRLMVDIAAIHVLGI